MRESTGDVDYEGEGKDVEDDTALVPIRRVMFCMNFLDSMTIVRAPVLHDHHFTRRIPLIDFCRLLKER